MPPPPATNYDELQPLQLWNAAQRIRDRCIAGNPPKFEYEHLMPNEWVFVLFEAFYSEEPGSGNWTVLAVNGTERTVNASMANLKGPRVNNASAMLANDIPEGLHASQFS